MLVPRKDTPQPPSVFFVSSCHRYLGGERQRGARFVSKRPFCYAQRFCQVSQQVASNTTGWRETRHICVLPKRSSWIQNHWPFGFRFNIPELHLYTLHHCVKVPASDCNAARRPRLIIFERFPDDCHNNFLLWFYFLWGSRITNQTRCYLFKWTREKQQKLRLGSHIYFHEWAR